jgi:periplasmic protein TonB
MLTFLLEKMEALNPHLGSTEHPELATDFSNVAEITADPSENTFFSDHVTIDLPVEVLPAPEIEVDILETLSSIEIVESQLVESLSDFVTCDMGSEGILEDCELEASLQLKLVSDGNLGHTASGRSFLASAFMHAFIFGLAVFVATSHAKGTYGSGGESVMVRFVADEESVPVEETPASVDSAASAPSLAGKPDQHQKVDNRDKKEQQLEAKEQEATEQETKKESVPKETKSGDGPTNSVASLPSVASEERRILSAGGSDMEDFQSRILAAIREAIHFPKEALDRKKHGETVVQFTVNRDGSVSDLRVRQESGSTILDEAALVIVRKASKNFPSIPDRVAQEQINYVVPILFKEKRSGSANN